MQQARTRANIPPDKDATQAHALFHFLARERAACEELTGRVIVLIVSRKLLSAPSNTHSGLVDSSSPGKPQYGPIRQPLKAAGCSPDETVPSTVRHEIVENEKHTNVTHSYIGTKTAHSTSSCTVRLAQGCVTRVKDVTVSSVEDLRTPPGLHTTARELQTCTFEGSAASNTTKIPRQAERHKESETVMGKEEKARNFGPSPLWGPHPSEPHPSAPHTSGPHPSAPHPSAPHPSGPHPSAPHPSGPDFFWVWAPPFEGPTLRSPQKTETPIWAKIGLAKVGQ